MQQYSPWPTPGGWDKCSLTQKGGMMRRKKSKFHAVTRVSPMPYNSFGILNGTYLICGNNITLTETKAVYGIKATKMYKNQQNHFPCRALNASVRIGLVHSLACIWSIGSLHDCFSLTLHHLVVIGSPAKDSSHYIPHDGCKRD